MLLRFPSLRRREESDDILQEGTIRLLKSLKEVGPKSVAGLIALAALAIHRASQDLYRSHFGRNPGGTESAPSTARRPRELSIGDEGVQREPADDASTPEDLACWSEFHVRLGQLPNQNRHALDLLYYRELRLTHVAEVMGISERQMRRCWHSTQHELRRTAAWRACPPPTLAENVGSPLVARLFTQRRIGRNVLSTLFCLICEFSCPVFLPHAAYIGRSPSRRSKLLSIRRDLSTFFALGWFITAFP